jgi:frataxin
MSQLFQQQARVFFQRLNEALEDQCGEICELDGDDRYLELSLPSGQVFLLNFHEPTQQIWLSSPVSGAHHYAFVDEEWRSTRVSETLLSRLSTELTQQLDQPVRLG